MSGSLRGITAITGEFLFLPMKSSYGHGKNGNTKMFFLIRDVKHSILMLPATIASVAARIRVVFRFSYVLNFSLVNRKKANR